MKLQTRRWNIWILKVHTAFGVARLGAIVRPLFHRKIFTWWLERTSTARKKFPVSGHRARRLRPAHQLFLGFFFFFFAMKQCPIAAKIAGSIGILPCCVWLFHIGVWTLARFVRLLSHHTLCMGNLVWFQYPCIHVSRISLVGQKKKITPQKTKTQKHMSPQRLWSRPMTRNRRLLFFGQMMYIITW